MSNKILVGHHGWSAPRQATPANKKEFYPWHIWTATSSDTSGNTSGYWMCSTRYRPLDTDETSSNVTHAGSIITDDHIYHDVTGTTWVNTSSNISVYLNITKNDLNSITGNIETSACEISLSGNPITYPVTLANLYVTSGRITVEQEYDVDYTDVTTNVSNDSFHPYRTFIKTTATTGIPNVYYAVTQNDPNVDTSIAGFVFSEDITKYVVSGIPWTQITADTKMYLNITSVDMSNAQGEVSDTPIAVQLDPTSGNRTYPILISEIVYNSGNPSLIVRKFEDHYLNTVSGNTSGTQSLYHPYLVTIDQDSSGNYRWNCNQKNDPVNVAGHVYNKDFTSYTVAGTDYNTLSSGDTNVYCNITEDSSGNITSAYIDTTPFVPHFEDFDYKYSYKVASISFDGVYKPVKVQHYDNDIYIDTTDREDEILNKYHPYLVTVDQDTSGNWRWNCNEKNDPTNIAGHIYNKDFTSLAVSGTGYFVLSSGNTNIYCNITEDSSGNITSAFISTTHFTPNFEEFPYKYSYKVAEIAYNGSTTPVKVQHYDNDIYIDTTDREQFNDISNHPYKVWLRESSGNYQWHCNEINVVDNYAGYIYTNNMTRNSVFGTGYNDVSTDTEIYCNITQTSPTVASGVIDTTPIGATMPSGGGFPITFSIHVADITFYGTSATLIQRYYDDIYTSYMETSASLTSAIFVYIDDAIVEVTGNPNFDIRHPYKTWMKPTTDISGNTTWQYAVSQFNAFADTSIAGYLYSQDHVTKYEVSGVPWTPVSADIDLYINVTYGDVYEASGSISESKIENYNQITNGQYNVLISEIRFTSGVPNCLVRKYEDEYVTTDNYQTHAFKVWVKTDSSGNSSWRCTEDNDGSTAGTIYSVNLTPSNVAGTDWTGFSDSETIYCNVTQTTSADASGYISTSAVVKSIDDYPMTYSMPVADINYNFGEPTIVQRINNDIYTDSYVVPSGQSPISNPETFGFKIWTQNVTSSNFQWGVGVINPNNTTIAGYIYQTDGQAISVNKQAFTTANANTFIYCNVTVAYYGWSGAIATSAITNAPFSSTCTFPVILGAVFYTSGTSTATIQQYHAGLIDYRGRITSKGITNYQSASNQLVGRSGTNLQWFTLGPCPSG